MTTLNATFIAERPKILHSSGSGNGITTQEEGEVNPAVIPDVSQRNEDDDEYISKSDLDTDDEEISEKPQISEKRRNQNKTFMSWFVLDISNTCTPF